MLELDKPGIDQLHEFEPVTQEAKLLAQREPQRGQTLARHLAQGLKPLPG